MNVEVELQKVFEAWRAGQTGIVMAIPRQDGIDITIKNLVIGTAEGGLLGAKTMGLCIGHLYADAIEDCSKRENGAEALGVFLHGFQQAANKRLQHNLANLKGEGNA